MAAPRALPLEPVLRAPLCTAGTPIELTVSGAQAYGVVFGSCNQVVAGNGTLARATPQLRAALSAIVGGSDLD